MATWSDLKFKLITTGDEVGAWGDTTNNNLGTAIEQAITGSATVTFASADQELVLTDTTAQQAGRALRLVLSGLITTTTNLTVPAIQKFYIVDNELDHNVTVKNPTGVDTFTVPAGTTAMVYSTGSGVVNAISYFSGALTSFLAVISGGTIDSTPIGSTTASTGKFTTLNATDATLTNALPVTSGGTGTTTSTGTGSTVLSASPTLTGIPLAPTAAASTNTTQIATTAFTTTAVSNLSSSLGTMATQNSDNVSITGGSIAASTITGTLGVNHGGTGLATLTSNAVLVGNGTSAPTFVSPSTTGNTLFTTDGTSWSSTQKITFVAGTTGGTSVPFTNIPTWAKRITLMYFGIGVSATAAPIVQVGYGATPTWITSGYIGADGGTATLWNTAGATIFATSIATATAYTGRMVIQAGGSSVYLFDELTARTSTAGLATGSGYISAGFPITAVRITTVAGTATISGQVNILYE